MPLSVVIAAGGTGGHLVPALAVADAVRAARPDSSIAMVGTSRALDRELVAGYRAHVTSVRPFSRSARGMLAPVSLIPATAQASRILKSERASVVVGMGGYASVPVVAAARLRGIPSVIHEANAVPGLGNEIAARLTPNIAVAFPDAARAFGRRRARVVGMPLRPQLAAFDRDALRDEAMRELKLDDGKRTVLVFGGSLGAARINAAALDLGERWRGRTDVQFVLIAGHAHHDAIRARAPEEMRILGFLDRMELVYAAADIAVCRAGGSTIAELAVTGLPSILIPLPFARRKEQHANAAAHARSGAAVVLDDATLNGAVLARTLDPILSADGRLERMAAAAGSGARKDAAGAMASWIIELAEAPRD